MSTADCEHDDLSVSLAQLLERNAVFENTPEFAAAALFVRGFTGASSRSDNRRRAAREAEQRARASAWLDEDDDDDVELSDSEYPKAVCDFTVEQMARKNRRFSYARSSLYDARARDDTAADDCAVIVGTFSPSAEVERAPVRPVIRLPVIFVDLTGDSDSDNDDNAEQLETLDDPNQKIEIFFGAAASDNEQVSDDFDLYSFNMMSSAAVVCHPLANINIELAPFVDFGAGLDAAERELANSELFSDSLELDINQAPVLESYGEGLLPGQALWMGQETVVWSI